MNTNYLENVKADVRELLDVCARCFVLTEAIKEVLEENEYNKGV